MKVELDALKKNWFSQQDMVKCTECKKSEMGKLQVEIEVVRTSRQEKALEENDLCMQAALVKER